MELPLIKDSSGYPSLTATAFVIGIVVANLKLLVSGVDVGSFKLSEFSGMDYAGVIGSLGAVYTLRNKKPSKKKEEPNESNA